MKLKGVGRPKKKKRGNMNPFDIGRCRLLPKIKKKHKFNTKKSKPYENSRMPKNRDVEANLILHTAEPLGLQLIRGQQETLVSIKEQLLKSNI